MLAKGQSLYRAGLAEAYMCPVALMNPRRSMCLPWERNAIDLFDTK